VCTLGVVIGNDGQIGVLPRAGLSLTLEQEPRAREWAVLKGSCGDASVPPGFCPGGVDTGLDFRWGRRVDGGRHLCLFRGEVGLELRNSTL
jgi:hypothetical protein